MNIRYLYSRPYFTFHDNLSLQKRVVNDELIIKI
jgi:hypothetical protein